MNIDQTVFNQIATTLAGHYDSLFYVNIETGAYLEFVQTRMFEELEIPRVGEDFFKLSRGNAHKFVHPDDLDLAMRIHDRDVVLENLKKSSSYSVSCRLLIDNRIIHIRHVDIMCEDRKHVLFCMENIDDEIREKEEQKKNLQSAERMARLDELTGIRNKNAFAECGENYDRRIRSADQELAFGIVMCDVNDLKRINDTRGHSFGDEALRRACRMISDVFEKSPVYRIGGDEFVVVLTGEEYQIREELLENLRRESYANGRSRSGPVVASGLAAYDMSTDASFNDVFKRADAAMYENKSMLKSGNSGGRIRNATRIEIPIPEERRRKLDSLFGAFYTMAGEGYVYLNDLRYDYSRWSMSLIDDFDIKNEYMYHAGKIWQRLIHPEDLAEYREIVNSVVNGEGEMKLLRYRVRRRDGSYAVIQPRSFIMNDDDGNPEYFGGIMIPQ